MRSMKFSPFPPSQAQSMSGNNHTRSQYTCTRSGHNDSERELNPKHAPLHVPCTAYAAAA